MEHLLVVQSKLTCHLTHFKKSCFLFCLGLCVVFFTSDDSHYLRVLHRTTETQITVTHWKGVSKFQLVHLFYVLQALRQTFGKLFLNHCMKWSIDLSLHPLPLKAGLAHPWCKWAELHQVVNWGPSGKAGNRHPPLPPPINCYKWIQPPSQPPLPCSSLIKAGNIWLPPSTAIIARFV